MLKRYLIAIGNAKKIFNIKKIFNNYGKCQKILNSHRKYQKNI